MYSFKLIYFLIFILNLFKIGCQISDKRLCYDEKCTVLLSKAKTLLKYNRPEQGILSFNSNEDVEVYSKEAGSDTSLWGVKIRGNRGYVNKNHIREYSVIKIPTVTVNTEFVQVPSKQIKETTDIKPDSVKQPYDIVDGTAIPSNLYDNKNPITTEIPTFSSSEATDKLKGNLPPQTMDESVTNKLLDDDGPNDDENIDDDVSIEEDDDDDDEEVDEEDVDVSASNNNMHLEKEFNENTLKMEPSNNSKESIDIKHEQKLSDKPVGNNSTTPSPWTRQKPQEKNKEEQVFTKGERKVSDKSVEDDGTAPSSSTERKPQKNEQEEVYSEGERKYSNKSIESNGTATNSSTEHKSRQKNEQELVDSKDERKVGDTSVENILSNPATEQLTQQKNEQNPVMYSENIESTSTPTSIEEIPLPIMNLNTVTPNPAQFERQDYEVKSHGPPATKLSATKKDDLGSSVKVKTVGQATSESPKVEDEVSNLSVEVDNNATSGRNEAVPELQLAPDNVIGDGTKVGATLQENTVDRYLTENATELKLDATITNEKSLSSTKLDDPAVVETTNNISSSQLVESSDQDKIENEPLSVDRTVRKDSASLSEAETTTVPNLGDISKLRVLGNLFGSRALPPDSVVGTVPESKDTDQHALETSTTHSNIATSFSQDNLPIIEDVQVSKDVAYEEETNSDAGPGLDAIVTNEPTKENLPAVEELPNAAIVSSAEETTGDIVVDTNEVPNDNTGFIASLYSFFLGYTNNLSNNTDPHSPPLSIAEKTLKEYNWAPPESNSESCTRSLKEDSLTDVIFGFNSDFLLYLVTTAISCIIFLFVYLAIDRNRREAPLVARINKLEKDLQVCLKENELLQERQPTVEENKVPNEVVEELQWKLSELQEIRSHLEMQVTHLQAEVGKKAALEEQIESLEKELETSTEVGMELTRIISEMLDSTDGSDKLKENMDQLQRQLLAQKDTINKLSSALSAKEMENCALHDDFQDSKRRLDDLQQRYDNVRDNLSTLQSEMVRQRDAMQKDVELYRQKYDDTFRRNEQLNTDIQVLKAQMSDLTRQVELKTKEYDTLKQTIGNIKSIKGEDAVRSLLNSTSMTAQLEQLKAENERLLVQTRQDQLRIDEYERKYRSIQEDLDKVTRNYEAVDKDKTEANMKLEVLNNYFKKRESELQEEVLKYKSIFDTKEGAATSTSERMKLLQEEIENYKSQNETLKQEIISQEIDLKSQISVLEKKVHENWVTARQTERKLEDSRHEAAQLRNRLTLQNRGGFDDMRTQNRVQSPVDQNGDTTLSPHPSIDSPVSPPLLYPGRDHITQSPPLPALHPPFLPPPPGAPFMPPPLPGMPHFMPPPPSMFPGDHRPPPLGRMSSPPPPLNSRFSPGPLGFSPYDRNSPSPPYDSEYGTSPPARGYSPFNGRDDRRDYKRPPPSRNKGRSMKGSTMSSGSEHSNDSLDKMNRKQSKIV